MNWKVNYWTLLFAAAAIGFFVYMYTRPICPVVNPIPAECKNNPTAIPADTAVNRIMKYIGFRQSLTQRLDSIAERDSTLRGELSGISNLDVLFFHLPKCEIYEMLEAFPDSDVYAFLGLEPDPKEKDKNRISLLFYDHPVSPESVQEQLDGDDDGAFYDFVNPCPTSCGGQ